MAERIFLPLYEQAPCLIWYCGYAEGWRLIEFIQRGDKTPVFEESDDILVGVWSL